MADSVSNRFPARVSGVFDDVEKDFKEAIDGTVAPFAKKALKASADLSVQGVKESIKAKVSSVPFAGPAVDWSVDHSAQSVDPLIDQSVDYTVPAVKKAFNKSLDLSADGSASLFGAGKKNK